jgi:hypothetical protein
MTTPHIDAVSDFLARKDIATRRQARRLCIVGRKDWKGAAAYVEFEDPDATDWNLYANLFTRCALRVIPLKGYKNWDYGARVEAEIRQQIEGPDRQ